MRCLYAVILLLGCSVAFSQNRTVGLLRYDSSADVDDELKLFSSVNDRYTYLINSCGEVINEWVGDTTSRKLVSYLMDGGNLVSAKIINDGSYTRPGKTGKLEIVDWNNNLLWSIDHFTGSYAYALHHDIEVMPDGHLLILLWDRMSREEAIANGRDSLLISGELWPESILEIEPVYPDTYTIYWQWHLRDHLIQDFDSTQIGFGSVSEHPELVDINYLTDFEDDWIHANAMSYNAERDEIILSSRGFDELWVIDHSTTTEEAASHSGGKSGKGGDLIFRFGNPYSHKAEGIKHLDGQHDTRIQSISDSSVVFSLFNNNDTDSEKYSEALEVTALLDEQGNYYLNDKNIFAFSDSIFKFNGGGEFDSRFMSSYERLPNGNLLLCSAVKGLYLEYNEELNVIWRYVSPVSLFGVSAQGDSTNGTTFKLNRYLKDDPIFDGLDLSARRKSVESGNTEFLCDQLTSLEDRLVQEEDVVSFFQNPVSDQLNIYFKSWGDYRLRVFGASGQLEDQFSFKGIQLIRHIEGKAGLKTILIEDLQNQQALVLKLLKID